MNQLTDPVFLALKAAIASTLAVLAVGWLGGGDALSAGFVALACTSPSAHAGLRRGLQQAAGSLIGATTAGLPQALAPQAHGAAWALAPGMGLAIYACFRLGLGAAYVVTGFTVLYFHVLPFPSPEAALRARMAAVAMGIGASTLVNVVASSIAGPRITARRVQIARTAVAAALRSLAARPDRFSAAFAAVSELRQDLGAAAQERLFPGAPRTRGTAAAGLRVAGALEQAAHLGKEVALLAPLPPPPALASALAQAAEALSAGGAAVEALRQAAGGLDPPALAVALQRLADALEEASDPPRTGALAAPAPHRHP